jgi:hypothetical protein
LEYGTCGFESAAKNKIAQNAGRFDDGEMPRAGAYIVADQPEGPSVSVDGLSQRWHFYD